MKEKYIKVFDNVGSEDTDYVLSLGIRPKGENNDINLNMSIARDFKFTIF